MKNIVDAWIAHEKEAHGFTQTAALETLNAELETQYSPCRLTEWKKERRTLPARVANYMLKGAVQYTCAHNCDLGLLRLPVPKPKKDSCA